MKKPSVARMFDRLPSLRLPNDLWEDAPSVRSLALARSFVTTGVKIVADNAQDYLLRKYPIGPDGPREMTDEDWPAFNCPFQRAWIEYRIQRTDPREHFVGAIVSRADVTAKDNEPSGQALIDALRPSLDQKGVRFIIAIDTFESIDHLVQPQGQLLNYVGPNGEHIDTFVPRGIHRPQGDHIGKLALPIVFAMAFMACSNVERVPIEPSSLDRRNYQRHFGRPLHRHYMLTIDAKTREEAARVNGPEAKGLTPYHIVAGNFAKYGIGGRGLYFGRDVRQVWRPEHRSGKVSNGTITKDYCIGNTPEEAA